MAVNCFVTQAQHPRLIHVFTPEEYQAWIGRQNITIQQWLTDTGFKAEAGNVNVVPQADGQINCVICCVGDKRNMWNVGGLSTQLPAGVYKFDNLAAYEDSYAIAWGLGAYQFSRYKKPLREPAKLLVSDISLGAISNQVESVYTVRDLINTPTENMGPNELAQEAKQLAEAYRADCREINGEELLQHNFPLIHAVGRACDDEPRLIDIRWGNPDHPKVTLVGKGVCFDTGGLDIKSAPYMLLMKKDMGGAAHVLGLARMIMDADLPLRLRVLIPAVENSISGDAYRPGDVIKSRKGITVEIGNTDAEGRLVLADAITEAVAENPDLLIDIATLTGAARVAVGTEIAAVFANNDDVVNAVIAAGNELNDPVWRLPLFGAYRESLNSTIADINNAGSDSYAGAITAALFLKEFVPDNIPWLHFDIMAWNLRTKPGRPQGGEAMAIRALFAYLVKKYG
jgi:leucyl aminopeptidase